MGAPVCLLLLLERRDWCPSWAQKRWRESQGASTSVSDAHLPDVCAFQPLPTSSWPNITWCRGATRSPWDPLPRPSPPQVIATQSLFQHGHQSLRIVFCPGSLGHPLQASGGVLSGKAWFSRDQLSDNSHQLCVKSCCGAIYKCIIHAR